MSDEGETELAAPSPGLFWLACESPWVHSNRKGRFASGQEIAGRLREAWKPLAKAVKSEIGRKYLEAAAEAAKRLNWFDCAGWMEAAKRTTWSGPRD